MKDHRARGRLVDARHDARERRLPAAGLADQTDRLPLRDIEIDAVDGVHDLPFAEEAPLGQGKMLHHPAQLQHALAALELRARAMIHAGLRLGRHRRTRRRRRQRVAGLRDPAARFGAGRKLQQVGMLGALVDAEGAPGGKPAAGRMGDRVGRRAFDGHQPPLSRDVTIDARNGVDQGPGVGVARIGEDGLGRALLDDLAGVHHDDARAHAGDHPEIVADQDDRRVEIAIELGDQVEDLGLDGDVERSGRLVSDQERRLVGEAHRQHDALPHAAGKLVRIAARSRARAP